MNNGIGKRSSDWIDGYVFRQVEQKFVEAIRNKEDCFSFNCFIPKAWFGLRPIKSTSESLPGDLKDYYIEEFKNIFSRLTQSRWSVEEVSMEPSEQYMLLSAAIFRVKRKLTLKQIESLLGYGVELVEED